MLSQHLREIRIEHNLTQKNIADVLGVDRTTYTYYETGATTPSPDTLYKLSRIYNVTVGYLMGVEENVPLDSVSATRGSGSLSAGVDPIASLSKEERALLMCFRVLSPEEKKKAIEKLREMAKATESI